MDGIPYITPPAGLTDPPERVVAGLAGLESLRPGAADGVPVCWCVPAPAADLALQWAFEAELSREGLDRAAVGADEFAERAAGWVAGRQGALAQALAGWGPPAALGAGQEAEQAARTAFVALYEAGLIERVERVLPACPRCEATLAPDDAEAAVVEAEVLVVVLDLADGGRLDVPTASPELMAAVTAVVVPEGHPAAGGRASLPGVEAPVPVIPDPEAEGPVLLTPGHDAVHWETGRRLGLPAAVVVDPGGTVTAGEAMGRFALRSVASEALAAEGRLAARRTGEHEAVRCRHCGTLALDRLGTHWLLAGAPVADPVADVIPPDLVSPDPAAGRWAAVGGWLVGRQLGFGPKVPVQWCLDCANPTVGVVDAGSCGACMGELRADGAVLDALFAAAAWGAGQSRDGAVYVVPDAPVGWPELALGLARRAGCPELDVWEPEAGRRR